MKMLHEKNCIQYKSVWWKYLLTLLTLSSLKPFRFLFYGKLVYVQPYKGSSGPIYIPLICLRRCNQMMSCELNRQPKRGSSTFTFLAISWPQCLVRLLKLCPNVLHKIISARIDQFSAMIYCWNDHSPSATVKKGTLPYDLGSLISRPSFEFV